MTAVTFELPDEVVRLLGSDDDLPSRMRTTIVLDLVRRGLISTGRAAELLGIHVADMLDLISEYQIPMGAITLEEFEREQEHLAKRDAV